MRFPHPAAILPAVAVVAGAAALAGCGGSAVPKPIAGHSTPAGATTGFLEAATANQTTVACSYVAPDQRSVCTQGLAAGTTISARNLHLGVTTISGTMALVTPLGTLCTFSGSKQCFDNTDPKAGQPTAAQPFSVAYSAVESGSSSNNDPAVPCTEVNGQW